MVFSRSFAPPASRSQTLQFDYYREASNNEALLHIVHAPLINFVLISFGLSSAEILLRMRNSLKMAAWWEECHQCLIWLTAVEAVLAELQSWSGPVYLYEEGAMHRSAAGFHSSASISERKFAEKLTILNERGQGILTRVYNIKKVVREFVMISEVITFWTDMVGRLCDELVSRARLVWVLDSSDQARKGRKSLVKNLTQMCVECWNPAISINEEKNIPSANQIWALLMTGSEYIR